MSIVKRYGSLSEVLHAQAEGDKSVTYVSGADSRRTVRYGALRDRALAILAHLQEAGLSAGDQMILFLDDNEKFVDAYWAAILGGIVPVPIAVGLSDEHRLKLFRIFSVLERPHLYTDSRNFDRIAAFGGSTDRGAEMEAMKRATILVEDISAGNGRGSEHKADPDDPAFIQFSSGSTSDPKGVVLTHRNLLTNINAIIEGTKFTPADVSLSWMPLTHDMGLIGFHLSMMASGMNQYLLPTDLFIRRPLLWMTVAADAKATILASPNFGYKHFLKSFDPSKLGDADLSPIRLIVNGAEPISASLCNDFLDALEPFGLRRSAMFPVYGLAEASLAATFTTPESGVRSIAVDRSSLGVGDAVRIVEDGATGSASFVYVGFPLLDCEIRLTDDDGNDVGEMKVGRLLMRGDNVTRGYYRNDDANREAIRDGWLDTGDLGFFKEGELVITGRAKEIIFVHGQNFYPHDLEVIAQQHAGAELGKVVAVGARGPRSRTEELVLFVMDRGNLEEFLPEARKIARVINEHAGVEVAQVIPIRRVPKTTSGKVQRNLLAEQYSNGEFDDVVAEIEKLSSSAESETSGPRSTIEQTLLGFFEEVEPDKQVAVEDNLFEIGLSSLKLVEIHSRIDETWPGVIDITEMFDYPTVAELAAFLEGKVSGAAATA